MGWGHQSISHNHADVKSKVGVAHHTDFMGSYSKKSRKTDPSYKRNTSKAPDTQLLMPVRKSGTALVQALQVDGPRLLSGANHRLYRQCGVYRMKIDLNVSDSVPDGWRVMTLGNAWHVKRAIQTARDMYDQAMADERSAAGQSRWHDFRMSLGAAAFSYEDALSGLQSSPVGLSSGPFQGEWDLSQITDANGNTKAFALEGSSSSAQYNIFDEYDNLSNPDQSPGTPVTGAYDGVNALVDSANIDRLSNKGNFPPYHATDITDRIYVCQGTLFRQASGAQKMSTGYFDAPLGLVWIVRDNVSEFTAAPEFLLEVAAGSYKGVRMDAY